MLVEELFEECVCLEKGDDDGGGGAVALCLHKQPLSSPRNNMRHDSHTVPLQLLNCVQHVCGVAAPSPRLPHADDERRRHGLMCEGSVLTEKKHSCICGSNACKMPTSHL